MSCLTYSLTNFASIHHIVAGTQCQPFNIYLALLRDFKVQEHVAYTLLLLHYCLSLGLHIPAHLCCLLNLVNSLKCLFKIFLASLQVPLFDLCLQYDEPSF